FGPHRLVDTRIGVVVVPRPTTASPATPPGAGVGTLTLESGRTRTTRRQGNLVGIQDWRAAVWGTGPTPRPLGQPGKASGPVDPESEYLPLSTSPPASRAQTPRPR